MHKLYEWNMNHFFRWNCPNICLRELQHALCPYKWLYLHHSLHIYTLIFLIACHSCYVGAKDCKKSGNISESGHNAHRHGKCRSHVQKKNPVKTYSSLNLFKPLVEKKKHCSFDIYLSVYATQRVKITDKDSLTNVSRQDAFFVSASLLHHPELIDSPVGVCHSQGSGTSTSSTSELASCNYKVPVSLFTTI